MVKDEGVFILMKSVKGEEGEGGIGEPMNWREPSRNIDIC